MRIEVVIIGAAIRPEPRVVLESRHARFEVACTEDEAADAGANLGRAITLVPAAGRVEMDDLEAEVRRREALKAKLAETEQQLQDARGLIASLETAAATPPEQPQEDTVTAWEAWDRLVELAGPERARRQAKLRKSVAERYTARTMVISQAHTMLVAGATGRLSRTKPCAWKGCDKQIRAADYPPSGYDKMQCCSRPCADKVRSERKRGKLPAFKRQAPPPPPPPEPEPQPPAKADTTEVPKPRHAHHKGRRTEKPLEQPKESDGANFRTQYLARLNRGTERLRADRKGAARKLLLMVCDALGASAVCISLGVSKGHLESWRAGDTAIQPEDHPRILALAEGARMQLADRGNRLPVEVAAWGERS